MAEIPLYLKLKGESDSRSHQESKIEKTSQKSIRFEGKKYDFVRVYGENERVEEVLGSSNTTSTCWIFIGPTGAGKTTTLRRVLDGKMKTAHGEQKGEISAFEVSENKHIVDLLEPRASLKRKDGSSTLSIESVLRKRRLSERVLNEVFSRRNTRKTNFNYESSRSCLVITFYDQGKRVTYIDLMGNERFDKSAPSSNVFANMNVSSITQLLTNKVISGRSSNLITNLIFRKDKEDKREISVILHLDSQGDVPLIRSALNNIATLVRNFKVHYKSSPSRTIKQDNSSTPHYAKPTISSMSPKKLTPTLMGKADSRCAKPTTSSFSVPIPKLSPSKRRLEDGSSPTPLKRRSPSRPKNSEKITLSSPVKPLTDELVQKYNDMRVISLGRKIEDLEYENSQLKSEHEEILKQVKSSSDDGLADFSMVNNFSELNYVALKAELVNLQKTNKENEKIISQKSSWGNELAEFKQEFQVFKDTHGSFEKTISSLKKNISQLQESNELLQTEKLHNINNVHALHESIETLQAEKMDLESRCEADQRERNSMTYAISSLEKMKDELSSRLKANEDSLSIAVEEQKRLKKVYEQSIKDKDEEIHHLTAHKSNMDMRIEEQETKLQDFNDEIQQKNKVMKELQTILMERDSKIELLENSLSDAEVRLRDLESSKSNNEELDQLKASNDEMKSQIAESERRYRELSSSSETVTLNKDNEINQLKDTIKSVNQASTALQSKVDSYNSELEQVKMELRQVKAEKDTLIRSLDELQGQVSRHEKSERGMRTSMENLRNENHTINKEIEELRKLSASSPQVESAVESSEDLTAPIAPSYGVSDQGQLSKSAFNPSEIFSDHHTDENTEAQDNVDNRQHVKKNKRVLGNSNKHESYKSLVNSISKDKKMKKKSSHKKNKSTKINGV